MSMKGIKIVAKVFQDLQAVRHELLGMGSRKGKINKQDIMLAQLVEDMKEATKKRFTEITLEPTEK